MPATLVPASHISSPRANRLYGGLLPTSALPRGGARGPGPHSHNGDARGSDSVTHDSIDLDGHPTEAALSATPDFETAGTSLPLGVPTDDQRTIYSRGSPDGPHKTCSAFDGCCSGQGGGQDGVDKMVSVELAGAGAADLFIFSISSDCADCDCGCTSSSDLAEDEQSELERAGQAPGDPCCTRHTAEPRT